MSKRANEFEHGRRGEEYTENPRIDDVVDPVRKASAAQLAARKLKTPKGRLGRVGSSNAPSAPSNPFASSLSSGAGTGTSSSNFNFGGQTNQSSLNLSNTPNFQFAQSTSATPTFGGASSTNTSTLFGSQSQQNQPSSSSVGGFGTSAPSQTPGFGFPPQSSTAGSGFGGNSAGLFSNTNNQSTPASTTPSNNAFGGNASQSFSGFGANSNAGSQPSSGIFSSFPPHAGANGSTGTVTPSTPNKGSLFGSTNPATASTPTNQSTFGSTNPGATTQNTPFSFGTSNTAAASTPGGGFKFGSTQPDTPSANPSTPFKFGSGNNNASATPSNNNISFLGAANKPAASTDSPASSDVSKPATPTFTNIFKPATSGSPAPTSNLFGSASVQNINNAHGSALGTNTSVSGFGSGTTPSSNLFSGSTMSSLGNGNNNANTSSTNSNSLFAKADNTPATSTTPTFGNAPSNTGSTLFTFGQGLSQQASTPPTDSINTTSAPPAGNVNPFSQSQPASHNAANELATPSSNPSFAQSQPAIHQNAGQFGTSSGTNHLGFTPSASESSPSNEQSNGAQQFAAAASLQRDAEEVLRAKAELEARESHMINTMNEAERTWVVSTQNLLKSQADLSSQWDSLATAENELSSRRKSLDAEEIQFRHRRDSLDAEEIQFRHRRDSLDAEEIQLRQRRDSFEAEKNHALAVIAVKREELRLQEQEFSSRFPFFKPSLNQGMHADPSPIQPPSSNEAESDKPTETRSTISDAPQAISTTTTTPTATTSDAPSIPRVHMPKSSQDVRPNIPDPDPNLSEIDQKIVKLAAELTVVNRAFKGKIGKIEEGADWSALSRWHLKQSQEIVRKIKEARRERARLNGVTGTESALSKRKAIEDSREGDQATTPKKARAFAPSQDGTVSFTPKADPPATNQFGFTPKTTTGEKETSQTSNLFGNILSKPSAGSLFSPAPKVDAPKFNTSVFGGSSSAAGTSPFGSAPTTAAGNSTSTEATPGSISANQTSTSGFKSSTLSASNNSSSDVNTAGFRPSASTKPTSQASPASFGFKVSSSGNVTESGSTMINAFAQQAKSAEQLAAERKAKAKLEDYDSDEETYEEWSARYDAAEAARKEAESQGPQTSHEFKGFSLSKTTGATPKASAPFSASKSSGSTSLFTSGAATPVPSTAGGLSVFNSPSAAASPSSNIFGHLSSNASSNNQDDSDEDEQDGDEHQDNRDADKSENTGRPDTTDTASEGAEQKDGTATPKPSLMSRITRDPPSNDATGASGTETPQNPFKYFDFASAGSKTAPPKPSAFAGDQTFKPGTPIKFGASTTESGDTNKPLFNFQPATPSSAETGAKPGPFSFLSNSAGPSSKPSFLAPNAGQSGAGSVASSVFSSRATTPMSDAATSDKDSTAQGAGEEDEEGTSGPQLDLSDLTEDEKKEYEVLFHSKQALAKHQTGTGSDKTWKNFARGPLWVLKNKETGKALVRMRLPSGATPVNFNILPKIASSVAGKSKTMVLASRPGTDGKPSPVYFVVKTSEEAAQFSSAFNANMPST